MQTICDRADFPAGTAVSGRSTADSLGINGPFTVYDTLMRERDALIYYRQMLERKRSELEQSLQKQRSEREVCPALFVLSSAEALLRVTHSNRVRRTFSTHGIAHQCVHNSAVLSPWSTPISSGVRAAGLTEYQKSFHAQYLTRILLHTEKLHLRSANQDVAMNVLTTVRLAPMLSRLELDVPKLTEAMVQYISQWEAEGQLEYVALRPHQVTPALKLLRSLSSLRSIDLSDTHITDDEIRLLSQSQSLVRIYLQACEALTNVNPLSSISTLEVILVWNCTSLTHVGELGKLPVLKKINLSFTNITDEEVDSLTSLRKQLCLPPIVIQR